MCIRDSGETPLMRNQILSEKEYRDMREKYEDDFDAGMGAEAVKKLLQQIDLESLSEQLHEMCIRDRPCTSWSPAVRLRGSGWATYLPRSIASLKCVTRRPVSS